MEGFKCCQSPDNPNSLSECTKFATEDGWCNTSKVYCENTCKGTWFDDSCQKANIDTTDPNLSNDEKAMKARLSLESNLECNLNKSPWTDPGRYAWPGSGWMDHRPTTAPLMPSAPSYPGM